MLRNFRYISVFALLAISFFLGAKVVQACTNGKWGGWLDTSSCVAVSCGTSEGTKTQSRTCEYNGGSNQCNPGTRVCDSVCPTVTNWSTSHQFCPADPSLYTSHDWKPCKMKIGGIWHYANMVTETFGPITFTYEKSADPNKCHRPTASSLGVPSWAVNDFNWDNPEWRNTISVNCRYEGGDTDTRIVSCEAPVISCEEEGQCPTTCGYEGGTVPDGEGGYKTCEATQACPSITPTPAPETPGIGGPGPASAPVCTNTSPKAPTLLSATSLGGGASINIKWTKVDGAGDYSIFYGPSSANYLYGVPSTSNVDNFTVNGLTSGCFVVRAANGCATSDPSNEVCTGGRGGQVLGLSSTSGESPLGIISFWLGLVGLTFGARLTALEASKLRVNAFKSNK